MCGIAGFSLAPNEKINSRKLAVDLLLDIESRGRDATGAAWWDGGKVNVQKDALKAKEFVDHLTMPFTASVAVLHTRAATQGSKRNCDNNHPVITGGIVGVHNGVLWNDDLLFRRMDIEDRRIGEVDTEAIFAAIAYGQEIDETGQPRLDKDLLEILREIHGSAAIGWLNTNAPDVLNVARVSSSPLVWAHTKKGSFIFASTDSALRNAIKEQELGIDCLIETREGTHLEVREGRIEVHESFPMPIRGYRSTTTTTTTTPAKTSTPATTTVVNPNRWKPTPDPKADEATDEAIDALARLAEATDEPTEDERTWDEEFLVRMGNAFDDLEYLLQSDHIQSMAAEDYFKVYDIRESNIEDCIEMAAKADPSTSLDGVRDAHGFVHPGCWVRTTFGDFENVRGQLIALPDEFPDGDYIIRLYVPNSRYHTGFEPVLVSRTPYEFEEMDYE